MVVVVVDCGMGNVTMGKVRAHWPSVLELERRWNCSGEIYIARVHTFERLLRFSIVVVLVEARCSDEPLIPPEKRKNRAALNASQHLGSKNGRMRLQS